MGNIILKVEKPKSGLYTIPVEVKCDSRIKVVNIDINIDKYIIPITPFSAQLDGNTASVLSPGDTSGLDGCEFDFVVDDVGSSYCSGRTSSSVADINGGGNDAMIIKRNNTGSIEWVFQMGVSAATAFGANVSGNELCHYIHVDNLGAVYCYGITTGPLLEPNGGSGNDIMILKLNPSGSLEWLRHVGATTSTLFGGDAVAAEYCRHAEFKNDAYYCAGDTAGGSEDVFFMKILADGTISWIKQIGATTTASTGGSTSGTDRCDGFGVDSNGSSYCTGISSSSLSETANGFDIFAIKIDTNGNLAWLTQIGSTTATANSINNLGNETCAFDTSGDLICGGFSTGDFSEPNAGDWDMLLLKFNSSNGQIMWHKQMGATTLGTFGGDGSVRESCEKIKVDQSNNIYCSGITTGSLGETVGGNDDLFIAKFNNLGDSIWLKQFGATTASLYGGDASRKENLRDFILDNDGNSYITGATCGSLGEVSGSFGQEDAYIAKLDSSGGITWINQLGSVSAPIIGANSSGREQCGDIRLDSNKSIYCSGNTIGSLFGPSAGNLDIFIWKLSPDGIVR